MQRTIKNAKSNIKCMAVGASTCAKVELKPRDHPKREVEENCQLRQQISLTKEGKELVGVNMIDTIYDSCGNQDHRTAKCSETCLVAELDD